MEEKSKVGNANENVLLSNSFSLDLRTEIQIISNNQIHKYLNLAEHLRGHNCFEKEQIQSEHAGQATLEYSKTAIILWNRVVAHR